ncbi:MAG TPA: hypothetical protein VGQ83_11085, partial [Polyangia bacterium]
MSGARCMHIQTPTELEEFRKNDLTVDALQRALDVSGAVLVALPVGVGKTHLLDRFVEHHRHADRYDLLLYLTSQRAIINERPWVQAMSGLSGAAAKKYDVAVLQGRPRHRCGSLDAAWAEYEAASCGLLGRQQLCPTCPNERGCDWPEQFTKARLCGKRVIVATQAQLAAVPTFVLKVKLKTGAQRIAVILDEATVLDTRLRARLDFATVEQSLAVFEEIHQLRPRRRTALDRWLDAHELLLDPLQDPGDLQPLPWLDNALVAELQERGYARFGNRFRFLGFEMASLAFSRRWRGSDTIEFVRRPLLRGTDYVIAAADVPLELARHRLDEPGLQQFCSGVTFANVNSEVYNIRAGLGAACHFRKNSPQILFTVAQLVDKLAAENKRAVIITKKKFALEVAALLQNYLREITGKKYRVMANAAAKKITDPLIVPVITYGVQGVNVYENFDAALAVNSYNAREDVLTAYVNDGHRPDEQV